MTVEPYRVVFDSVEWQAPMRGARFKVVPIGPRRIRLVEFTNEFEEPQWCERGHVGLVLQGELEIDFQGGIVRYPEGTGIAIPAGPSHGHKARSVTPLSRLFLVEDI